MIKGGIQVCNLQKVSCWIFLVLIMTGSACSKIDESREIRKPAVEGQFYPADKVELVQMIDNFIANVPKKKISDELLGIIVPHAGYVFSGQVAAYGFKLLEDAQPEIVILIGQSHYLRLSKAAVYDGGGFQTPLGIVPVDRDFVRELVKSSEMIESTNRVHQPEHSLEVELPFLQVVLKRPSPHFKIVPILVSQFSLEQCEQIATEIVNTIKKRKSKVMFVISTDMSHYPEYKIANEVDSQALKSLEKYDPHLVEATSKKLLAKGYRNLSCVFCGEQAVITGMYATKLLGGDKIEIVKYANSGDVPVYGDKGRVVGYCAVAFLKTSKKEEKKMAEFLISPKNQKILLELARKTIKEYLQLKKILPYETFDSELTTPAAVFVTLHIDHQLRGCIGTTVPQLPLYQAVQQMAVAAAFEDYRFRPVSEDELKKIKIEISVLSPMTKVKTADEIKPNLHGVVVRRGGRSGLFLPQVWEQIPKKEDFLSELCYQKAGLNPDAWQDSDTELYIFTVFAFEE
ncbi:MAG: AmmeMemoRadiSam system protein B [Elusimicrobiota bacterium]|nr:AmmeMemoRadiSam system protein B [Elusimicrobiota bacterium]